MRRSFCWSAVVLVLLARPIAEAAAPTSGWKTLRLPAADDVQWSGPLAEALERGVARLAKEPYTVPWLLADVSFEVNRIFTNYSGDVSGRFLELAALTSPRGQKAPASLAPVLDAVTRYQKTDGHFGVEVDLSKPLAKGSPPIPMLWGNAPEFKTRPNTLRPHVRRNAQWTIADPVLLPTTVRRGESHHILVECRGAGVVVLLDAQRVYSQSYPELQGGGVGFRASGLGEQGLFRHISLRKL